MIREFLISRTTAERPGPKWKRSPLRVEKIKENRFRLAGASTQRLNSTFWIIFTRFGDLTEFSAASTFSVGRSSHHVNRLCTKYSEIFPVFMYNISVLLFLSGCRRSRWLGAAANFNCVRVCSVGYFISAMVLLAFGFSFTSLTLSDALHHVHYTFTKQLN